MSKVDYIFDPRAVIEPSEKDMTIVKCGFDKTAFKFPSDWETICYICGLTYRGELPEEKGFEWRCDNKMVVITGDNPITGKSRNKALSHEHVPGWAGYIGVEGLPKNVLEFVGLVL